jgi:hypothetical protein
VNDAKNEGKQVEASLRALGVPRAEARRTAIIHRKKFQGGRCTPEEFHSRYAFPKHAQCPCGAPPMSVARTYYPLDELVKQRPEWMGKLLASGGSEALYKLMAEFVDGIYVRVAVVYACKAHRAEMERAAAQGPSWARVHFNHGPGEDKPMVGYSGPAEDMEPPRVLPVTTLPPLTAGDE